MFLNNEHFMSVLSYLPSLPLLLFLPSSSSSSSSSTSFFEPFLLSLFSYRKGGRLLFLNIFYPSFPPSLPLLFLFLLPSPLLLFLLLPSSCLSSILSFR